MHDRVARLLLYWESEVALTVPDYVAIGVLIVLMVWRWRIGFHEASYSGLI
jgi:hypothetical protein